MHYFASLSVNWLQSEYLMLCAYYSVLERLSERGLAELTELAELSCLQSESSTHALAKH
jgi:hypothetical protein